jgi:phospholipid N-methyltransferase
MVEKLLLEPTDMIFEPCGGDGVFVEAIIDVNENAHIDIYELNPLSVKVLQSKFSTFRNVTIKECDTLLDNDLILSSNFGGIYDKIIANPPYGAWQDIEKRAILKNIYSDLYAKESYALFLFRCIELLKDMEFYHLLFQIRFSIYICTRQSGSIS